MGRKASKKIIVMASKEMEEADTVLVSEPQQEQLVDYDDTGAVVAQQQQQQQQEQQPAGGHDYTGVSSATGAAEEPGAASDSNENKWNKNGYGQASPGGVSIRTGKYSKEETAIIVAAVKEYCAAKQITVSRLCSECDHKADLKGSWMEIAKCLPNRPVQSVYRHGLRQLHPFKRGAWSDDEVEALIGLVARVGKKWAHIQAKLNRTADSCRDKYREIDDSYIRGRWKESETEQLKRFIREYLRVDPRSDLKDLGKMVEADDIKIPWSLISKRMGNRSRLSCFKKWQKMTGLYSPCDMHRLGQPASEENGTTGDNGAEQQQQQQRPANDEAAMPAAVKEERVPTITDGASKHHHHTDGMAALSSDHASAVDTATPSALGLSVAAEGGKKSAGIAEDGGDIDVYLLSQLVALDVSKASEIDWDELDDAQERWYRLLEEWQSSIMDDSLLALPISEIAQLILERKTNAQRAAETVEAVDLPTPLWNHD